MVGRGREGEKERERGSVLLSACPSVRQGTHMGTEDDLAPGTEQFQSWMCFGMIRATANISVERRRSNGRSGRRKSQRRQLLPTMRRLTDWTTKAERGWQRGEGGRRQWRRPRRRQSRAGYRRPRRTGVGSLVETAARSAAAPQRERPHDHMDGKPLLIRGGAGWAGRAF